MPSSSMNDYWFLPTSTVVSKLETNLETGLSEEEVSSRLSRYGENELPKPEETPFFKLVLKQFQDFLVLILLFAACVSFILALLETDSEQKLTAFVEPFVILAILLVNAAVGVSQELNAERAIIALKKYEAANALVLRNGLWKELNASQLVPGDVIKLSTGCKIPADSRICKLQSSILGVDQSILTGESDTVSKDDLPISTHTTINSTGQTTTSTSVVDQDKTNMVFSGTLVTRGKAIAVVCFTGQSTSIGKIWKNLQQKEAEEGDEKLLEKHKSPLKEKLDEFGETLSKMIFAVCVLVWLINVHHFSDPERGGWIKGAIYYFKIAVALAVAAVPEGLPAVVTTCLALGAREMAKEGALVRSLPAVETLGCTTVICADKTGTITTNQMSVKKMLTLSSSTSVTEFDVDGEEYIPKGGITSKVSMQSSQPHLFDMARVAALCNDSKLDYDLKSSKFGYLGEPTEAALRVLVEKIGIPTNNNTSLASETDAVIAAAKGAPLDLIIKIANRCSHYWEKEYPIENVLEFTRSRKSMSVICKSSNHKNGKNFLFCKGAAKSVLLRCDKVRFLSGKISNFDDSTRELLNNNIERLGTMAFRCLALAQTEISDSIKDFSNADKFVNYEQKMTLLGIVAMIDPPRPQVALAIEKCQQAGMRVVVVTGDDQHTAEAIARNVGLLKTHHSSKQSISGEEWAALDDRAKKDTCQNIVVMHRVEPAHKLSLVRYLKSNGEVVAMTGDGVNDAPALKCADIGIGMGSGTAVAREASDMVLADDNFATIVVAVRRGRAIYQNTKQFIRYLVSSNLGEVGCIFFSAALGIPEALLPVQLLWVNLVTDGLPATALGFNPPDPLVMQKKPRQRTAPIVDRWSFIRFFIIGLYVGCAVVMGFIWWFTAYEGGPKLTLDQLRSFEKCDEEKWEFMENGFDCNVFHRGGIDRASTVSLSILVFIEMLNAFNALSENQSLLDIGPMTNRFLLIAVSISVSLHLFIVYVPLVSPIFGVAPLDIDEWGAVIWFSFPVIIIDEVLKYCTRKLPLAGVPFTKATMSEDEKLV